jgi:hypothetical protein
MDIRPGIFRPVCFLQMGFPNRSDVSQFPQRTVMYAARANNGRDWTDYCPVEPCLTPVRPDSLYSGRGTGVFYVPDPVAAPGPSHPSYRFRMRLLLRPTLLFILSLALIPQGNLSAHAQQVEWNRGPSSLLLEDAQAFNDGIPVHRTPELIRSAEGQAALAELKRLYESGELGKRAGSASQSITPGTQRSFQLLDFTACSGNSGCPYFSQTFTLMVSDPLFNIWVANPDLATNGGKLVAADWEEMAAALGTATPAESWNPNKGIIAINEEIFGPPSDIDGNGRVDVLVHDIKDGYNPGAGSSSFTAGYYSPSDLTNGNKADIIHLDTYPSMYTASGARRDAELVLQTLAHEFQHLIFAVVNGNGDFTFTDEGLAEWAEVVNGYTPRPISYLADVGELSRNLLDWRESSPYGGPNSEDYQRGGLFHHYLAERLSIPIVGSIARSTGVGVSNYTKMLTDLGLDASLLRDLVQGFHVANLINDPTLSPSYGYASPFRQNIRASGHLTIDGGTGSSSSTNGSVNAGAVRYIRWSEVGDFTIDLRSTSGGSRLSPLLLLKPALGAMERGFPEVGGEPLTFTGDFEDVYLVLPHTELGASAASYTVSASWSPFESSSQFQSLAYDNGEPVLSGNGGVIGYGIGGNLGISLPLDTEFANAFDVPTGAALSAVDLSLYFFDNPVSGDTPASSVRDFTLKVYGDQAGKPGDLILSKTINWTGGTSLTPLSFQRIDLSGDLDILEHHQGRIYVSVANAGTDDNHVLVIMSEYANPGSTSPGFLYFQFGSGPRWAAFDDVVSGGTSAFENQVLPLRAVFDLTAGATDAEQGEELPRTLVLEQNYPNPFNPSTQIRFQLPTTGHVQVQVFDLLGRQVAQLVNAPLPAGAHEVTFDASTLPSGLYLYAVTTPDARQTRTMTLIK